MPTPPDPRLFSGWRTASFPAPPQITQHSVPFRSPVACAAVSILSPDIIRIRFSPAPAFSRDHSYVVEKLSADPGPSEITTSGSETTILTRSLQITIHHAPFGITFADLNGRVLDEDETSLGTSFAGSRVQIAKRLDDSTAIYGLGEKTDSGF